MIGPKKLLALLSSPWRRLVDEFEDPIKAGLLLAAVLMDVVAILIYFVVLACSRP